MNDANVPCRSWVSGCGGGFGNFSSGGRYQLNEDEALIIGVPWVPANPWGESHDYTTKQTSLNGFQAHLDNDQVHRYVLAHEDPGVPNWLDISDHPVGFLFIAPGDHCGGAGSAETEQQSRSTRTTAAAFARLHTCGDRGTARRSIKAETSRFQSTHKPCRPLRLSATCRKHNALAAPGAEIN